MQWLPGKAYWAIDRRPNRPARHRFGWRSAALALQRYPIERLSMARGDFQGRWRYLAQGTGDVRAKNLLLTTHHHEFHGPQYGPQLYSEASSLICAAANWSCAIDCCNPSCLYF